jgi:predicted neuraminidase
LTPTSGGSRGRLPGRGLLLAIVLIASCAGFARSLRHPLPARFQTPVVAKPVDEAPRFESRFVAVRHNAQAHAPSLVELKDGRIRAFWYSGTREGAQDVEIDTAVFEPGTGHWVQEKAVASRESTERSVRRFVQKVGNPIAGRAADGTLSLFYVSVSVGGWAGSSITVSRSLDEGETWGPARRLITSPFFNLSTLVRSGPFLYKDGTMGLPVYHELLSKYGELLRLDRMGAVIDEQRLSSGGQSLQPVVLVKNENEALALMRYSGAEPPHRVMSAATQDAGQHWTPEAKSSLLNPDAGLSGVVLPDGRLLVALNNMEEGRTALSLVLSKDGGRSWRTVHPLEDESMARDHPDDESYLRAVEILARTSDATLANPSQYSQSIKHNMCWDDRCHFEFSYPYLIQTERGKFHVVYDWNRTFIKHVEFNQAWLDQKLTKAFDADFH